MLCANDEIARRENPSALERASGFPRWRVDGAPWSLSVTMGLNPPPESELGGRYEQHRDTTNLDHS
jgi:hypothetical protein